MVSRIICSTPGVSASDFAEAGVLSIFFVEMAFFIIWDLWLVFFVPLLAIDQILTCCITAMSFEGLEG